MRGKDKYRKTLGPETEISLICIREIFISKLSRGVGYVMRVLVFSFQANIGIKPNICCEGLLLSSSQFITHLSRYLHVSAHLMHWQIRKINIIITHTHTHTEESEMTNTSRFQLYYTEMANNIFFCTTNKKHKVQESKKCKSRRN